MRNLLGSKIVNELITVSGIATDPGGDDFTQSAGELRVHLVTLLSRQLPFQPSVVFTRLHNLIDPDDEGLKIEHH